MFIVTSVAQIISRFDFQLLRAITTFVSYVLRLLMKALFQIRCSLLSPVWLNSITLCFISAKLAQVNVINTILKVWSRTFVFSQICSRMEERETNKSEARPGQMTWFQMIKTNIELNFTGGKKYLSYLVWDLHPG